MDLKSKIFLKQPRENDGSRTSNRYDYQKNWAICKLTELHSSKSDYLLSFEFHDDIIVFDSSTSPSSMSCYQLKSREKKPWSLGELYTGKKGKTGSKPSYLAKLYFHLQEHGASVAALTFVTNNYVNSALEDKTTCSEIETFTLSQLSKNELTKLAAKMEPELGTKDLNSFYKLTSVLQHALDINHHSRITQAILANFIETVLPNVRYQIGPLYRTIFDEVRTKTNLEHQVLSFEDLKRLKSISRADFEGYLEVLSSQENFKELAHSIENRLNSEHVSFQLVADFAKYAKRYEVERMDHTNNILHHTVKNIQEITTAHLSQSKMLNQQMEEIYHKLEDTSNLFSEAYLKTIILFELYGKR